jgi:hypothetical protein
MNWLMQLTVALALLTLAGGVAGYLANPGNGSRGSGKMSQVLVLCLIGFGAWGYVTDRFVWVPGGERIVSAADPAGEQYEVQADVQRLLTTARRLEAVASQLDRGSFPIRLSLTFEIAIAICLIILTGGAVSYTHKRMKQNKLRARRADALDERLGTLEERVQDVQDVVITLDDQTGSGGSTI